MHYVRNTLIIILGLFILIAVGLGLYLLYGKKGTPIPGLGGNPFGTGTSTNTVPSTSTPSFVENNIPVTNTPTEPSRLRRISQAPIAGFTTFTRNKVEIVDGKRVTRKENVIRFIERGTGNIFETTTTTTENTRLTNTTYPRIQEAFFTSNGNSLIIRTLNDIDIIRTYLASIKVGSSTEPGSLTGFYIDDNISFISVSPDTTRFFVLKENPLGATGYTTDAQANKNTPVFSSTIREWLPQWFTRSTVALTTRASSGLPGALTFVNTTTGGTESVLSDIRGLTTLVHNDGSHVLYSESSDQSFRLSTFNKKTGKTTSINTTTFPEKCVWSSKTAQAYCLTPSRLEPGKYPDDWYQGLQSSTDSIWKITSDTGASEPLFNLEQQGVLIDGIRPTLTTDETYLLFMNKKDGSLWSYQITL